MLTSSLLSEAGPVGRLAMGVWCCLAQYMYALFTDIEEMKPDTASRFGVVKYVNDTHESEPR